MERAQEGAEGGDEDDLLELNELAETEASLYFAINSAVKQMLKEQGAAMPVQPFLPFLQLVGAPSTVAKEFALRLLSDIIEGLGEESFGYVGQYFDKVLGALNDEGKSLRIPDDNIELTCCLSMRRAYYEEDCRLRHRSCGREGTQCLRRYRCSGCRATLRFHRRGRHFGQRPPPRSR